MTGNAHTNGTSNLEIAQSNQDLIITKGRRKKRTWIIIGIVSLIVIALVVTAIVLLTTKEDSPKQQGPTISLEDIFSGKINPEQFNATWTLDNELLYTDADGNLVLHSLSKENRQKRVILPAEDKIPGAAFYDISADGKYLKVAHRYQNIYRHSFFAEYTIINLSNLTERIDLHINNQKTLLLVEWAPVGNALAFVYQNNIYYKPSVTSEDVIQITSNSGHTYNGIPDWVYEEEVFSSNKALWFSPDGTKIAFGKFDDNQVPSMVLPIYGEPGSILFQYPKANLIKYPKAGTQNPTVSLHCVSVNDPSNVKKLNIPIPLQGPQPPILSAVAWATSDTVSAIWMNRIQNKAFIVSYSLTNDSDTMETNLVLEEDPGWLELFTPPLFSSDGSNMVLILSSDQGGNLGAYRHVVMVPRQENAKSEPLTKGAFVVTEILGWNHQENKIFYLANTEKDPGVQYLYSVSVDTRKIECLSCGIKSKNKKQNCLYNSASFSKDSSVYVLTCEGPDIPDMTVYGLDGNVILNWDDNEALQNYTRGIQLPKIERHTFDIEGGFKAHVSLKLPTNMDTSGRTKYPMLVNVYAGPDSYQVVEKFNIDWGSYLAANKSIIYATIDGRSSGLKGNNMLFASYRHLGTVEIFDQINVTRQIHETLKYVDSERTAVWGWSYGGYASAMMLADDTEGTFKCGISVAPVTDWTLYDSIYTERFMGLPSIEDNYVGYRNANLLLKYAGIRDKQYFLIHGTHDDNVHYQQSMLWAKVLEERDILFRQLSYPDENHSLGNVRPHLYHSLEDFLDECFIDKEK